jgi:nucleoside-diphosphate-sugar epimerase
VDDAARACVQPILTGGGAVETFNVSAPPVAMREVVEELGGALGRPLPGWHVPATLASGVSSAAALLMPSAGRSLAKWMSDEVYPAGAFERRFNFSTRVALRDGIARQVAWWRARTGEADQS